MLKVEASAAVPDVAVRTGFRVQVEASSHGAYGAFVVKAGKTSFACRIGEGVDRRLTRVFAIFLNPEP